jgi:DNA primase
MPPATCLDFDARASDIVPMSLPPGFIDELRTRTSLTQVVGRKVMWDVRKSNQGKGDMWAPCPFHQEKSASFHVDDRKGFYYCFGCQAKGDAISFVQETENVGFMEAVQILAGEAGLAMPARDPQAQKKADRRSQLAEVMEAAVQFFAMSLKTAAGQAARDYLDRRSMSLATRGRFDIGYAPDGRQATFRYLCDKGIAPDLIIDAGLAAKPDDGGAPYDRFRGRIIFPIRDARGRCIALGGRSMDANARAKYLNSPETELFDKGRSLYNHGPAREAAGKDQQLIVAEGYMDVIALAEAGFGATVAPLGTAITEDQLRLMWRIHPEPVIALDGDKAGLRAAMRVIDLALPLLEAGQALRFAIMPEGLDPDDLIRDQGHEAMQAVIDGAVPMVKLLWQRETDGKVFDSPERKAALDKSLRQAIRKIKDPSIRQHYGDDIKDLRWQLFRGGKPSPQDQRPGDDRDWRSDDFRGGDDFRAGSGGYDDDFRSGGSGGGSYGDSYRDDYRGGGGSYGGAARGAGGSNGKFSRGKFSKSRFGAPAPATPTARGSFLVGASDDEIELHMRACVILAACVSTPSVVGEFEEALEELELDNRDLMLIRDAVLRMAPGRDCQALRTEMEHALGPDTLETLFALNHVKIAPAVRNRDNDEIARQCMEEEFAKLDARRGLKRELSEAMEDLRSADTDSETLTWRLQQAAERSHKATRSETEDKMEYDTGENGAVMNREERGSLDELLSRITYDKPNKP